MEASPRACCREARRGCPALELRQLHDGDNSAISGLTAAGKTTHAQLLAYSLNYEYVSATRVMLEIAGVKARDPDRVWFSGDQHIREILTDIQLARDLTAELIRLATTRQRLVIDTWGLSWVFQGPLVRIWIDSDRLSRTWKCYVSQGNEHQYSIAQCAQIMDQKDLKTRELFREEYNIDIFSDRSVFDVVLDNSWLIREPTRAAADAGIRSFDSTLRKIISYLRAGRSLKTLVGTEYWSNDHGYQGAHVRAVGASYE